MKAFVSLFFDEALVGTHTHAHKLQKSLLNGLLSFASKAVCIITGMIIPSLWLILDCLGDKSMQLPFYVFSQMFITVCERKTNQRTN